MLQFLRTQRDTRYLARPRLLTLNNEIAEIKITTQESVGVTTTTDAAGNSSATVERSETGVTLRVTPQINLQSGEVTMFIYPEVGEATAGNQFTTADGAYQFRDPEKRSTKTLVRVKDGDTVIVGGLIRNEYQQTTTKIPFLGDLPLIGALFRHRGGGSATSGASTAGTDKSKQRELLVFITPHIIKDKGIDLAQAKQANKVNLPEREQGAFSAIDRQAIIKTSLNSFERK
jgi:type II secretory pathway component GspD/PulD (secretin)